MKEDCMFVETSHSAACIPVNAMPGPTSEGASIYDPFSQSSYIPASSPSRQVGSAGTYAQQSQQSGQPPKTQETYAGVNTTSQQPFNPQIALKAPAQTLQTELGHRDDQSETYGPLFSFHRLQQTLEPQNGASDSYQHSLIQDLKLPESFAPEAPAKLLAIRQDRERQISLIGQKSGDDVRSQLEEETKVLQEFSTELPDASGLRIRARAPSSSPTVSSDVDVVSVSEDSEGTCQLDRNTQGFHIFSRVFRRLAVLGQQDVMARGESSGSGSKGKQVAQGRFSSSSGTRDGTSSTRGRKNQRQDDDHGDEGRDKRNEPPRKRGKTSRSQCEGRSQFLACPYWKSDPERYWDCFMKKNDTIAHLKQHLTRRHTPRYYCQICYQTFKDFDPFDSHALKRACTRGPLAKLEGISQQQKNQLSLKSKGSVEQQWYNVWSILFPDRDPPATIFIHSTQSEDFCCMQEFAQREGVAIMLEELDSSGLLIRPDASRQQLQSTVQRAMVSIFRNYSIRREPSSEESEETSLSQALEPGHGVSSQQESTTETQVAQYDVTSTDVNRMMEDGMNLSMMERSNGQRRSTLSQSTNPWLTREALQNNMEEEPWEPAFLNEPAFEESSSGNDLSFSLEMPDSLDLDALLRDMISTAG
ncbi:hypothetical protein BFJ68_g5387 [Fusarium oxysporum]|uniref:C2H2-type domain-containing protein n=1 Tax=Fusarium oxysporum TaxID=5507 RepID=A0A420Q882_FUSOX|nr:hypothetical protein BFJ71_g5272 [Fusarium oxysporum]RKL16136.1 hypothetical protein BFJ68_g5387 [Fusarium oxysporum]